MSEIKWIKITTDMFDDEKIKLIEAMPEADMILIIWIKLLTLAGKKNVNGYIFLTENIPYTDEMLATIFNRPVNTIRLALDVFKKFNMIEYDDNNNLKITNWEKHQNIEGLEKIREQNRLRVQKKRGLDKLLIESSTAKNCIYCDKEVEELTIDHIIPLTKNGRDDIENKVLCCLECNMSKNNRDLAEFLNERIKMNYPININGITHNKKLMNVVEYKDGEFIQRGVTRGVTTCDSNTTDKNRLDKNRLDKNIYPFTDIVNYLNIKTGKSFRHTTKKTQSLIRARINEGFTLDDFKKVIDTKTAEWRGKKTKEGANMEDYLRPETLFGTKFESYLNQQNADKQYGILSVSDFSKGDEKK